MADFIPSFQNCRDRMKNVAERRVAEALRAHVADAFLCWYDKRVGAQKSRYPDFLLFSPSHGLLGIEVKAWSVKQLGKLDEARVTYWTQSGEERSSQNPLVQVRQCVHALLSTLQGDPKLIHTTGRYAGKLIFPYSCVVAFPNISRKQAQDLELERLFPDAETLYQDNLDSVELGARLERLLNRNFVPVPQEDTLERVKWHIFPEIRINSATAQGDMLAEGTPAVPETVKVMDADQERIARGLGSGHRVIHGVAGSGKTQIIIFHCERLAQASSKPTLLLYFNIATKALPRMLLARRGVPPEAVHIRHFHQWCQEQVSEHAPGLTPNPEGLIEAVEKGLIPKDQYGAIIIDEGRDFELEWLKAITDYASESVDTFLFAYDDAQDIYSKKSLGFSLNEAGIQARGRTSILGTNYRNTVSIVEQANRVLEGALSGAEDDECMLPTGVGRDGPMPIFTLCESLDDEDHLALTWVNKLVGDGVPLNEIAVLVPSAVRGRELFAALEKAGIEAYLVSENRDAKEGLDLSDDQVKVSTIQSAKGLEFRAVFVASICELTEKGEEVAGRASTLLYVGITRATERLHMSAWRKTALVAKLGACNASGERSSRLTKNT